jgi:TusA-related sulfurtransferase
MNEITSSDYDYYLDITSDICPMTFVKTKLLIERMSSGQTAEIRLGSGEPLENVPRAVVEHGHELISLDPSKPDSEIYILRLRKT